MSLSSAIFAALSCSKYTLYRQLVIFAQAIIVCLIMTIRTYALYGCSKRLLTWLIIILVALAGGASVGTFGRFSGNTIILPGIGCYETYTAETSVRLGLAWMALFVFDSLIFALTVHRICKTRGLLRLSLVTRKNVIDTIFHDGAMYFGAMALSNIPNILTYYSDSGMMNGTLGAFTSCMSVTLISRLMLNLHKSIDTGIFSTPAPDDDPLLTTRVNGQSEMSSYPW
ncbi:hypothetical protein DEU56DRAFT_325853 [Suillus clintonianus]|uniref:uncharacterized protein n=1 Tax=Suillus clintonianus TaxID=1904413 RepID=UPI001B85FA7F|nr:uncharacterized protein DEU56DRAFT_325853 [Suillus clintonianus]KAG2139294.1 hypothetical protein DEU56DRAFT_325853 [Suillus clintonianus]